MNIEVQARAYCAQFSVKLLTQISRPICRTAVNDHKPFCYSMKGLNTLPEILFFVLCEDNYC